MVWVRTEEELGAALKSKAESIIIEGDLVRKVIRIRAVGAVAWLVAFGAIAVVVIAVIAAVPSGGTSGAMGLVAAPAAVSILGSGATATAISIAVAAGGVGALNKLRNYDEVKREGSTLHLTRR